MIICNADEKPKVGASLDVVMWLPCSITGTVSPVIQAYKPITKAALSPDPVATISNGNEARITVPAADVDEKGYWKFQFKGTLDGRPVKSHTLKIRVYDDFEV